MNILLALLLTQSMTSAEGLAKLPRFADYCTEAGPIYLGFDGQSVDASYRIILPSKDIPGTMKLQWSGPFLQGRWYDNDGDGPIIIVFHNEMNELTALYTSDDKVTSWSEVWPGTRMHSSGEYAANCPPREALIDSNTALRDLKRATAGVSHR